MKDKECLLLLAALAMFQFAPVHAQPGTAVHPYEMEHVFGIRSEILNRAYDLYIKLPRSYVRQPTRKYPVLFLHDAPYAFPLACSLTRQLGGGGKIEDLIIVGISYSTGDDPGVSRTRDYTPTNSPDEPIGHSALAKEASGEAQRYLRFITEEVFPELATKYRVDMSRKTYAGHSFGGLFGAYIALVAPETFENYVISDPSLWYDDKVIFSLPRQARSAKSAPDGTSAPMGVLLIGANPRAGAPPANDGASRFPFNMVGNVRQLESMLKNRYSGSGIELRLFDGEIHETVFPIALSHGLLRFHGRR